MIGTVYKSTGSWYLVKSNGKLYKCRIKGKFRLKIIKSTNPISVGDKVDFYKQTKGDEEIGVIENIHQRDNYIIRKSVNLSKQTQIIASNIDQVFLLITIDNPPTSTLFIDRFLVAANTYSIKVIIVFNKIDSYGKDQLLKVKYLNNLYKKINYTCIEISATENKNIDIIKKMMISKTSMFLGHSGVGKTTLINSLEESLNLKTNKISNLYKQGQHTTTFAQMFDLSFNARIIDTPGIKGFGVVDIGKYELGDYFPEFFKLKQSCKFNNCIHLNEPKCAVKEALENKKIALSRYKSYLQILKGEEQYYRSDIANK